MAPVTIRSMLFGIARGLIVATGIAIFAVGLLIAFVPGMERLVPIDALIAVLGSDYFVVATVGLAAVALGIGILLLQAVSGIDEATLPVVETIESAPHPGHVLDASMHRVTTEFTADDRRARLRETAIRTLVRCDRYTRSEAEQLVASGDWTDDQIAAAFLAGDADTMPDRFRAAIAEDERVLRTANAIQRLDPSQTTTGIQSIDLAGREPQSTSAIDAAPPSEGSSPARERTAVERDSMSGQPAAKMHHRSAGSGGN